MYGVPERQKLRTRMSWRAFVSRNARAVRVFVDPTQIAPGQKSHGLMYVKWYCVVTSGTGG